MNELEFKINAHTSVLNLLHHVYMQKNHDYGDSFGKSYKKYGISATMVRIEDKWNRLDNLINNGQNTYVPDESVSDTLLDLANYAIMTYMELNIASQNKESDNQNDGRVTVGQPVESTVTDSEDNVSYYSYSGENK